MMTEDIFMLPETPLALALRVNSEIITALAQVELSEENIEVITQLLENHSNFVIDAAAKIVKAERLDIRVVK
jgi:hypothetical protein